MLFFKEIFHIHYGQQYQAALQTLVWKFISRLDHLLPVPDIKQTAEWLSSSPSVMEECGQLVLEPDQLKELLHFQQKQSASTNKCFSQSQNMFLPRLSLPPKQNAKLPSERQAFSAGDEDEGEFYYSEDEEPLEDTDVTPTVDDCSRGDEDLKVKEEQIEDLAGANCSNLNNHPPLRPHTCSLCSYSDSQVSGLMQHIREAHMIQEPSRLQSKEPDTDNGCQKADTDTSPSESGTPNACEYCGKAFMYVSTLQSHIKTHTLPFHCDRCDKKYASMASLHVHRRNHTGETPYLCSHCGRGFRTSHSLSSHVSIHTGERRYKCHICGKTSIQHLARHMRMHRGEKNYLCTECGKAFLSSGELRLHMRYHTGERPYTCKHCGKGFVAKCFLTVHMRRHTGESPYKCAVCPKSFHTLRAQKKHMQIHSNAKSFQCLKCGKIFRQEDTFKLHLQTHT
uniref:zinc finger protein 624-like n=1 Tax=Semicossyphus pulcher TaxID=241346 RepID=UPI0037E72C46